MTTQYTSSYEQDYRHVFENHDGYRDGRFITTDPSIIKKIDKYDKMKKADSILCRTMLVYAFIILVVALVVGEFFPVFGLVFGLANGCVGVIGVIGICILETKGSTLQLEYEDEYINTDEYKQIKTRIEEEKERAHQEHLKEVATDLVESYSILENKKYSKAKKIELLKQYIERGEKRCDK